MLTVTKCIQIHMFKIIRNNNKEENYFLSTVLKISFKAKALTQVIQIQTQIDFEKAKHLKMEMMQRHLLKKLMLIIMIIYQRKNEKSKALIF